MASVPRDKIEDRLHIKKEKEKKSSQFTGFTEHAVASIYRKPLKRKSY